MDVKSFFEKLIHYDGFILFDRLCNIKSPMKFATDEVTDEEVLNLIELLDQQDISKLILSLKYIDSKSSSESVFI